MNNREFTPRDHLERVLAYWWIVLILTILGGVTGWIFHFFQPPIYEATAGLTINLLFEKRELTQYEADTAFSATGVIITSTKVMDILQAEAQNRGLSLEQISRIHKNSSVERMESNVDLHVRDRDPVVAAAYANLWADIAEQSMNDALEHALLAEQLQNQLSRLQTCLPPLTPSPEPVITPGECSSFSLNDINVRLQGLAMAMADEMRLSKGVLPITSISLNRSATVPEEPVIYAQASLVFAGACIGFFLSLWLVNIPWLRRVLRND
jgi:hypothetical protein